MRETLSAPVSRTSVRNHSLADSSIFPLPLPSSPPPRPRHASRRSRQRHRFAVRCWGVLVIMVRRLNGLWAHGGSGGGGEAAQASRRSRARLKHSAFYRRLMARLLTRARVYCREVPNFEGNETSEFTEDELVRDLRLSYGGTPLSGPQSRTMLLTPENVSLPPVTAQKVDIVELLPPEVSADLTMEMVRVFGPPPAVPGGVGSSVRGVVAGRYTELVLLLVERGVVELVASPAAATQGVFGVYKKEDVARLILDAQTANALCHLPPSPDLPLIESLLKLVVPPGQRVHLALLDLADYYHCLVMPEDLRALFGLPQIRDASGTVVYPRWKTLPMGFSWAVYLAQLAHTYTLQQKSATYRQSTSLSGPPLPRFMDTGTLLSGVYIDDVVTGSLSALAANSFLDELHLAETIHAKKEKNQWAGSGAVKVWGILCDAVGCFRPPVEGLSTLIAHTRFFVQTQKVISTRVVQRLVGKWLWYALLVRPCLSLFTPLFRQARSPRRFLRLWPSSLTALQSLIDIAPLLHVDPSRPMGSLVATDSSSKGGGWSFTAISHLRFFASSPPSVTTRAVLTWVCPLIRRS